MPLQCKADRIGSFVRPAVIAKQVGSTDGAIRHRVNKRRAELEELGILQQYSKNSTMWLHEKHFLIWYRGGKPAPLAEGTL